MGQLSNSGGPRRRRPVILASYQSGPKLLREEQSPGLGKLSVVKDDPLSEAIVNELDERTAPPRIRQQFPPAGPVAEGGHSDGYCYRIPFAAGKLAATYTLITAFLQEQGYGDVPLPADVEELKRFRLPPKLRHQLSLFGEDGYVHNPIKILFPTPAGRRGALLLEIYDEAEPGHLLKFHRR